MTSAPVYRRWRLALFVTWVGLGVLVCAAIVWFLVVAPILRLL